MSFHSNTLEIIQRKCKKWIEHTSSSYKYLDKTKGLWAIKHYVMVSHVITEQFNLYIVLYG